MDEDARLMGDLGLRPMGEAEPPASPRMVPNW